MEAIQKAGQVLVFTDILSVIVHQISDGNPIPVNGTGLQFSFFKKVQKKINNLVQRANECPPGLTYAI